MKHASGILALLLAGLYGWLALQAEAVSATLGWIAATLVGLSGFLTIFKRG